MVIETQFEAVKPSPVSQGKPDIDSDQLGVTRVDFDRSVSIVPGCFSVFRSGQSVTGFFGLNRVDPGSFQSIRVNSRVDLGRHLSRIVGIV